MSNPFFDHPILNSPYECPTKHWELDDSGQPTQKILDSRRDAKFITPIPKPKKRKKQESQGFLPLDTTAENISSKQQEYYLSTLIGELRNHVTTWRNLPHPKDWRVTPETARLLQHWRHHKFTGFRPFFCQLEAVEVAIWLTEVAPKFGKLGQKFLDHLDNANAEANPGLNRLALKLATGAGKTTVMAMLIAWQTINAVRYPTSHRFSKAFLVVAPGITIKDRLQVLRPNDPNSYYASRELVPIDMMQDMRARVVITNFHAFKLREKTDVSRAGRALLNGRHGENINTLEPEGQMLQRVIGDLMGDDNIIVFNDEAHHCYREKQGDKEDIAILDGEMKGEATKEANANNEAARLWISGLEIINKHKKRGITRVFDLSATPFFLRGSGYGEGTLFPWTMSDFSLMDAIECGIVKLPRVPVADNISSDDMPVYRNLWANIRADMPKAGRGKGGSLDPQDLPTHLVNAMNALYGHYEKTSREWEAANMGVPPCFIIVCNNTSTSKLVYDYISGYEIEDSKGQINFRQGRFELFRNYDENGNPLPRMRTLLIDSEQLESGEKLSDDFKKINAKAIERFHREIMERGGPLAEDLRRGKEIDDTTMLREVMNTVGKPGQLGGDIRCVVSVSMLTEGWDANTVTHVLGVRAFGTQLLCEQVIGRALRRQSYTLNDENLFDVEYSDVLGIPFDFTAKPVVSKPVAPRKTVHVQAVKPDRNHLEIRFPRVEGYRVELPKQQLRAEFTEDSTLELTPALVGPTEVLNAGIIGATQNLKVEHQKDIRPSALLMHLTNHLMHSKWRDDDGNVQLGLFADLKNIVREWLQNHLNCTGGTYPAILLNAKFADMACEKIQDAINRAGVQDTPADPPVLAVLQPYNPTGSTIHVNFMTTKQDLWQTDSRFCHINWVVSDSDWEAEFCRVIEKLAAESLESATYPKVKAYVKNHNLGFEVPYHFRGQEHMYRPDFIVLVDDGHGEDDLLYLVVEIKGYRGEDAKAKKQVMDVYWIPGVNRLGAYGRWAFAELKEVYRIETDFEAKVEEEMKKMLEQAVSGTAHKDV
ncbi:DEAD/DEAH box helicase family protein [Desulfovibrio sp. OttesenSCG-928-A18]|nr:DEAD/DEAH box helicase family protein [Desulfovibrio sp. OttesenSCG-928-A18]